MNILVRQLRETDAHALKDCFRRCYGDTYPNDVFYNTKALAERIRSGHLRSIAAFANENNNEDADKLIGHTGLTLVDKTALIAEAGNTIVDPAHRGRGILGRMSTELSTLCREAGFKGYIHFPTTAHPVVQQQSVSNGGVETGLMLGYIPAEIEYKAIEQRVGRISATIAYQPLEPLPAATVCVPAVYAQPLDEIYQSCGLYRQAEITHQRSTEQPPERSVITTTLNTRRGLLATVVEKTGADLGARMRDLSGDANIAIMHVDLLLDDPHIAWAVEILNERQFFFAGLLPQYRRTDVLRLQWCADTSLVDRPPQLSNAGAVRLFEWIQQEVKATR